MGCLYDEAALALFLALNNEGGGTFFEDGCN